MEIDLKALEIIHTKLRIDEPWTIREPRAFTWIAHRLAQRTEASPVFESLGMMISRVTSSVTIVEDVGVPNGDVEALLASLNRLAVGSAYVYSPLERTVNVMLAHNVHEEMLEIRSEEIGGYQIIALVLAESRAERLADMLRGSVARRQHVFSGERVARDDMLNVIEGFYQPQGAEPNQFASPEEIEQVFQLVRNTYDFSAGGSAEGIAIEVAFGEEGTTLIQLVTDQSHPELGAGLGVFFTVPLEVDTAKAGRMANSLNLRQFTEGETVAALGAWCARQINDRIYVAHTHFLPNAHFRPGAAVDAAMTAINQAVWVDGILNPGFQRRSALPAIAKRINSP